MLPSPEAEPERYRRRPLLVVWENYILAAIGELPTEKQVGIARIVQNAFGGGPDWMTTVRGRLQLDDGLDADLRGMWDRNQTRAAQGGVALHSVQFAKMVADENFAELIGPPLA